MKKLRILSTTSWLGLCVAGVTPGISSAVTFDISWTGANGYSMTGMFSYDDGLIGTGVIDETSIDTLMIEGVNSSGSIGTWNLTDGTTITDFNFNFDTTTETFIIGGSSGSTSGQAWNWKGTFGLGFVSGAPNELFSLDGVDVLDSLIDTRITESTLTATRTVVPVPAAAYLFGGGILWLFGVARRKAA